MTVHFAIAQAGVRFQISGEQAVISVRPTTWRDTMADSLARALERSRRRS